MVRSVTSPSNTDYTFSGYEVFDEANIQYDIQPLLAQSVPTDEVTGSGIHLYVQSLCPGIIWYKGRAGDKNFVLTSSLSKTRGETLFDMISLVTTRALLLFHETNQNQTVLAIPLAEMNRTFHKTPLSLSQDAILYATRWIRQSNPRIQVIIWVAEVRQFFTKELNNEEDALGPVEIFQKISREDILRAETHGREVNR